MMNSIKNILIMKNCYLCHFLEIPAYFSARPKREMTIYYNVTRTALIISTFYYFREVNIVDCEGPVIIVDLHYFILLE
jgi:hypothetical protein